MAIRLQRHEMGRGRSVTSLDDSFHRHFGPTGLGAPGSREPRWVLPFLLCLACEGASVEVAARIAMGMLAMGRCDSFSAGAQT